MGANLKDRVKKLFTKLLIAEGIVGAIALVIVEFFPRQLIDIFGAANESFYYTDFAVKAFRIYLCMKIFACINKADFIFLQAMGKSVASTVLSMVREIVFGVGLALILPIFFGLDGVLYSIAFVKYTYSCYFCNDNRGNVQAIKWQNITKKRTINLRQRNLCRFSY